MNVNKSAYAIFAIAAVLAGVWLVVNFGNRGTVRIVNKSKSVIEDGKLSVARQDFTFRQLAPGNDTTIEFFVRGDSDYQIKVRLSSGKVMSEKLGYITSGVPARDDLYITDDKIELKQLAH